MILPMVIEKTHEGERAFDIYSRLLKDRIVFLGTAVTDEVANSIVAQLLHLEQEDSSRDIHLYINSPGGSITAGMAIYDTMQLIRPDVSTICLGKAASMGAVLMSGGKKGKRYILPNAEIMIHQPLGGTDGQASDILISARRIERLKTNLYEILAKNTGKKIAQIEKDGDRDYWMTAQESVEYGIVDAIIEPK